MEPVRSFPPSARPTKKIHATSMPTADAVMHALDKLLIGPQLVNAPRASRFLRFIVEAVLDGRGDSLKEYVIGVEVFDRQASFDPRIDTIVRVEAAKLRKRVREYYRGPGRRDLVVIELPKGGYVPQFRLRALSHVPSIRLRCRAAPRLYRWPYCRSPI
jgi:hypothetical protein